MELSMTPMWFQIWFWISIGVVMFGASSAAYWIASAAIDGIFGREEDRR